ncbi:MULTISPECIES: dihydroneopterin aldolase [Microbacterium]|uniref:7,8-dihydroneopterin aldolase n=1 Tax=Microbacterium maritypicum TaxID=33918 RepID=A0AAD3X0V1_MICMQ|nr:MULTISPECIES: dihydroneopterin aldolase [Microbacterium]AZS45977.1 Dihydroneopterin aldolase [Microbacterium oxydans]KAB1883430.1 dihydroneopterin aldolase [Microbacterium liquefaciens]KQV00324.1 diguanylate cyclase [Microbacterium sp. Root322]KQY74334.1 diguanylate cyclase [Microbacterium sp. Root1433D1]WKT87640.1 dihydroneopterin aldolase [Microbacterium liquefaciens]
MQSLDEIVLTGLTVFGRHGVFDHERRDGQDFTIDLRLRLSLAKAADSDEVTDTVHYGELAEKVAAVVAGEPVNLIETLAERIAAVGLEDRRVQEVVVTVHKPHAPIPLNFADVAVTITRRRTTDAMEDTTA